MQSKDNSINSTLDLSLITTEVDHDKTDDTDSQDEDQMIEQRKTKLNIVSKLIIRNGKNSIDLSRKVYYANTC